jgi:hypothetical protein
VSLLEVDYGIQHGPGALVQPDFVSEPTLGVRQVEREHPFAFLRYPLPFTVVQMRVLSIRQIEILFLCLLELHSTSRKSRVFQQVRHQVTTRKL